MDIKFNNKDILATNETLMPINGYEHYYISNHGRCFSVFTKYGGIITGVLRLLKVWLDVPKNRKSGYLYYMLYNNGEEKQFFAHRLVAKSFIPNPENKREVNHKDGNKLNNHVDNLEWATSKENTRHAFKNGLRKPKSGESHYRTKFKERDIIEIRRMYDCCEKNMSEISRIYNVTFQAIFLIVKRKNWVHI